VTAGAGTFAAEKGESGALGQYDVILARPEVEKVEIKAAETPLHFLSFYLPRFLS
jgi:hypothetical protein